MSHTMAWNLVRLADAPPQPWKNGGGHTRELLAWPDGGSWRLRISVADITQDGPFSQFDGVQRWFAVLEGGGVRLRIADTVHSLTQASAPMSFDGGVPAECELPNGPTRDFNLMVRGIPGQMQRIQGRMERTMDGAKLAACYGHQCGVFLQINGASANLQAATLAWCQVGAGDLVVVQAQDALWMEVPC